MRSLGSFKPSSTKNSCCDEIIAENEEVHTPAVTSLDGKVEMTTSGDIHETGKWKREGEKGSEALQIETILKLGAQVLSPVEECKLIINQSYIATQGTCQCQPSSFYAQRSCKCQPSSFYAQRSCKCLTSSFYFFPKYHEKFGDFENW